MNEENHTLHELARKASESLEASQSVNLSSPEIKEKIEKDLKPILNDPIFSSIIEEVAMTIADTQRNHLDLISKINHIFAAYECRVSYDTEKEFTSNRNPASIQFIGGKLHLKISEDFKDLSVKEKVNQFLRELVHELGALLLLQKFVTDVGFKIITQDMLEVYKSRLIFTGTKIGLTHIIDKVLLLLIEEYRKK